jgi:hypothetical protein
VKDPYYLLLFAYPRRYRRERGRELVDMYRELSGDRRRPTVAEAADLIVGGVRERVRAAGLGGLPRAVPAASVFTLAALAGLSVYDLLVFELRPTGTESFGPFASVYVCAYLGWLVTAVTAAVLPGRLARTAAAVTLALLAGAIALRFVDSPWHTLNLYMGLPLAVLGVLTLALPAATSWTARLAPLAVAAGTALAVVVRPPLEASGPSLNGTLWEPGIGTYGMCCNYLVPSSYPLHLAAVALLIAGVAGALAQARRGSSRGAWTLLVLATPIAALATMWLSDVDPFRSIAYRFTGWNEITACIAGILAILLAAVGLPAAVALGTAVRRIPPLFHRPDPAVQESSLQKRMK